MWFSCMKKLFSWYFRHIFEYFITQLDNFLSTKLQHTMLNLRKRTRNSLYKFPILFLFVNSVDLTAKIKGSISPFSFSCCFWFCVVVFFLSVGQNYYHIEGIGAVCALTTANHWENLVRLQFWLFKTSTTCMHGYIFCVSNLKTTLLPVLHGGGDRWWNILTSVCLITHSSSSSSSLVQGMSTHMPKKKEQRRRR